MTWFASAVSYGHDLNLVCLDQEMNHVIKSSDDGEAEIQLRGGEFASGKS
jgi:hypothetical protein